MASWSAAILCLLFCMTHAMRQTSFDEDDGMVCECKEVKSVDHCPDYKITKKGFPPGFPRYYHEKVQAETRYANLCCKMSPKKQSGWKIFKRPYVAQSNKDRCLEETRPIATGGCCTVAGSDQLFGDDLKIVLSSAKVYSMAHPKMLPGGNPTWKDYEKKSKVFIQEGISHAFHQKKSLKADKLRTELESIKKLLKTDTLQCTEGWGKVAEESSDASSCAISMRKPTCCCEPEALTLKNHQCVEMSCGPHENPVHLKAKGIVKSKRVEMYGTIYENPRADFPDPYKGCSKRFTKNGATFTKAFEQMKTSPEPSCTDIETVETGIVDRLDMKPEKTKVCIAARFPLICPGGHVLYDVKKGQDAPDMFTCAEGYKSNIRADPEYDSRCSC